MAFINWSSTLSVENKTIDLQHQRLIAMVNDLFEAMSEGKGNDILGKVFEELVDYTKSHFHTEQTMMKVHEYPDMANHIKEHDDLTAQVLDLYDKFRSGQATISVPVLNFLRNWLNNHILTTDKKFGQFLNSKNIS